MDNETVYNVNKRLTVVDGDFEPESYTVYVNLTEISGDICADGKMCVYLPSLRSSGVGSIHAENSSKIDIPYLDKVIGNIKIVGASEFKMAELKSINGRMDASRSNDCSFNALEYIAADLFAAASERLHLPSIDWVKGAIFAANTVGLHMPTLTKNPTYSSVSGCEKMDCPLLRDMHNAEEPTHG